MQNTLRYLCYDFAGYLHKMPRVHKWTCLHGSEWTPFVDVFFMQQHAETRQINSKLTAFYYNSVLIVMLCIWQSESLVINIIVCPARDACWRDNHRSTTMKRFYCSATQPKASHTRSIIVDLYTLYIKCPKCYEITCTLPDRKKILSFTLPVSIWVFLKI